jgi:long-chain fatty acid transport protein
VPVQAAQKGGPHRPETIGDRSMHKASRFTHRSALAVGIAGVFAFGQAGASGFQLRENSVKNLGRSQAGTAVANGDAAVVSNNPGAMGFIDQNTVQADVTVIDLTAKFDGGACIHTSGTCIPDSTAGDGGDPGDATPVPAIAAVFPMHGALEKLTLGASIGAPFGLKTEYDSDWVGRYNAVTSDVKTVDLTLSAALKVSPTFSVGAGFIYEKADVTLSNMVDYGAIMASTGIPGALPGALNGGANDGLAKVSGNSHGIGWVAGFEFRPFERFAIGYSHRSEIDQDIDGHATFNAPATFQGAQALYKQLAASYMLLPANDPRRALIPTLLGLGNGFVPTDASAALTTPSIDTVSLRYDFSDNFRMMADWQQTDWHSLRSVDIHFANPYQAPSSENFEWNDSRLVSLGAEWDISPAFTLRGGVAQDKTPTHDDTRSPRLPDNDRTLVSIGVTWHATDALSIDAAYQHISIKDPNIDAFTSLGTELEGKFNGHADLFGIAAQYRF